MDTELLLVLGLVLAVFAIPSIMSAITDGRSPRAAAVVILIAGGMVLYAIRSTPGGYALGDLPDVFVRVVGRYMP